MRIKRDPGLGPVWEFTVIARDAAAAACMVRANEPQKCHSEEQSDGGIQLDHHARPHAGLVMTNGEFICRCEKRSVAIQPFDKLPALSEIEGLDCFVAPQSALLASRVAMTEFQKQP